MNLNINRELSADIAYLLLAAAFLLNLYKMDTKQKYVRLKEYDSFIFFPEVIKHSTFKHLNPISAGFCYLSDDNVVKCFGESYSLNMQSKEDDTQLATKQVFGIDAMLSLLGCR